MMQRKGPSSRFITKLACLGLVFWGWGCAEDQPAQQSNPNIPRSNQLPELVLTDDTPNLLITWLDERGEFHVVQKLADVPEASRKHVRVVQTTSSEGHGDLLYVADLTRKLPSGAYPVANMARSEWDELGASKRRKRLEALAPSAKPTETPGGNTPEKAASNAKLSAIVYGADWCRPCHDAEAHLKRRGVQVTYKNIEKDASAAREMQQKLKQAQMSGASIPIIDLAGRLYKGFSPRALDSAISSLQRTETL